MPRRTTTIGKGSFGYPISKDSHERDVVQRIINKRLPLTEDAVFILMRQILRRNIRLHNEIDNNLDSVLGSITSPFEYLLDFMSNHDSLYFSNVLANETLAQWLSAYQGSLLRTNELKAPTNETLEHLQAYKEILQDIISAIQSHQIAISSENQAIMAETYSDLEKVSSQARSINLLAESLMVKYNIPDTEVNYMFRGK